MQKSLRGIDQVRADSPLIKDADSRTPAALVEWAVRQAIYVPTGNDVFKVTITGFFSHYNLGDEDNKSVCQV
jgi:hypothetical protein